MAGGFSGHLVNTFEASQISSHGPMSFNPSMHGTPSFNNESQGTSEETLLRIHRLQAKLNQKLGPEYISQRPGPGGQKLTYAEGWKIINLANEVFGFNGWSSSIVNLSIDTTDFNEESRKWSVGVSAIVRVTLRDGTFHEDIGYGILENSKTKGPALDKVSCSSSIPRSHSSVVSVQEGSRDRCVEASFAQLRQPHGQLFI